MNMGDNNKSRVLFFFFLVLVLWCVPSFALGRVPSACDPKNGLTRSLKFCRTNMPIHVGVQNLIERLRLQEKTRLIIQGDEWWSEALHSVSNVGSGTKFGGAFPGATSVPQVITTAASSAQSLWNEIGRARFGKSNSRVKEEAVSFKAKNDEKRDLLIEGGGALLHATALGYLGGLRSACGFILKCAVSDDYCKIAKARLEKSQNWVEEKVRATGISDEQRDLLIRSGGALVLAPAIGYWGGFGSAFGFLLSCAPPDNYYYQMAQNRIEMSKSWVAEKLRAQGITDEQMDLLIKAGGAVALAASIGYDGFKGRSRSANVFDDSGKLMKAPGRPGELIVRAAFEADPRAYFRKLRRKHP